MTTTDDTRGGVFLAERTRLEEFEIKGKDPLGAGGFGVTYLAHDTSLKRQVAIKEYLPHDWGARGPDGGVGPRSAAHEKDYEWGLERFLEEAQVLAGLHHAHVVQVYRVIEAWGTAYMVTEYVEGGSLASALASEGPWREARVLALLDALTAGLARVHAKGLIHRDIKPANVMLREDGSPVLIDFGAARQAVGGRSGLLTAVLTPGYAPFEQYNTKGRQGPWTDVYALGAVAYEALSGRVPEESSGRMEEDELPPVTAVAAHGLSSGTAAAVMSALALRRQDRPQSLAEWRALLGLGTTKPPPPEPPRPPEPPPDPVADKFDHRLRQRRLPPPVPPLPPKPPTAVPSVSGPVRRIAAVVAGLVAWLALMVAVSVWVNPYMSSPWPVLLSNAVGSLGAGAVVRLMIPDRTKGPVRVFAGLLGFLILLLFIPSGPSVSDSLWLRLVVLIVTGVWCVVLGAAAMARVRVLAARVYQALPPRPRAHSA